MPTYTMLNTKTEEVKDMMFPSHGLLTSFTKDNPDWCNAFWLNRPNVVAGTGDGAKPDAGFKEVLSRIADQNQYSPMADTHGSKSATDVKVRETVNKVRKKHS